MKKMLFIGWDAADWQIINPLVAQGKMPALAGLLAKGCFGNLATLDPPISPMLWTSIASGVRPYKHGIHGFTEAAPDGKTARPVRVTSRTAPAVWNVLNDAGLKTNVVGWWPSHPAERLKGASVSNFFGADDMGDNMLRETVFPEELLDVLKECTVKPNELTPEILKPFFPKAANLASENDGVLRSVMRILAQTASTHAATTYLLENTEWQFSAVYFDAIDHLCHLAMKYHPPKMPHVAAVDFENYHYIVEAGYRFHDMMLERLITLAGDDCAIILVSDHGFVSGDQRLSSLPNEPGAPALEHNPFGVFLAAGPGIASKPIYGASLLDLAPTILQYFDVPLAEDFDGRVLPIFVNQAESRFVPTYRHLVKAEAAQKSAFAPSEMDARLMRQLRDLGYLSAEEIDSPKAQLAENEYYLARSLADGGYTEKALLGINRLVQAFPETMRYAVLKAGLLLRMGQFAELEDTIKNWPQLAQKHYFLGMIYLNKGKILLAEKLLAEMPDQNNYPLLVHAARAWLQRGKPQQAANLAERANHRNPQGSAAWALLGEIAMYREDWETALEYFFESLKWRYYQPQTHAHIGQAFYALQLYAEAAQALQLALQFNPANYAAAALLKEVLVEKLQKPEHWQQLATKQLPQPIVVVTGHPRSGTSMLMQMLAAGGVPIMSDAVRQADAHNAKGYFELEAVKQLAVNQSFLKEAFGKAVKIVIPLLRLVQPFYPLQVIWIKRPVAQSYRSQQAMLGKQGGAANVHLLAQMNAEEAETTAWLNRHPHISYLQLEYENVVNQPLGAAKRIAAFLGGTFNTEKAAAAVQKELRHF